MVRELKRRNKTEFRKASALDKCLSPRKRNRTWLIKYYFFIYERKWPMKEIGEALKEQRESIGVTIEEAAVDLKLKESQIEAIENGDKDAFPDVFYLKYFIRDYSKYLGLNYEDMIDEFNEFLFDYTSKISIEDIKKARKQVKSSQAEKRVASPYTIEYKRKWNIPKWTIYIFIGILVLGVFFIVIQKTNEAGSNNAGENIIK